MCLAGRRGAPGKAHIISERLQFAAIDSKGEATNAGIAPHLNLRPAKPEEIALTQTLLDADWLRNDLEKTAVRFATVELAQRHAGERCPPDDKFEGQCRRNSEW